MFRKTTAQMSFFDVETVLPNILPQEDWSVIYKNKIYPLIDEDKFKDLYDEDNTKGGRPNKSVKTLVSILIFMSIEKLTWREAEYQFSRRLDWLLATNTSLYESSIDHTTLFKFYCRLEENDKAQKLFEKLTKRFIDECGTIFEKQRTDSFFMHGWLQILSRYGLFKETIRVFLQNLRKQKSGLYENIKDELSRDYLGKEFDLTEKEKEKAQRQIKLMAEDMYVLYKAFLDHNQVKHYQSFKTLTTVFNQQCESIESESGEKLEIVIRDKPEGEAIISSPHNTDARYVKKGDQKVCGQKGFITETCDERNQTEFITDVELRPSTTSDTKELPLIQERLNESEMKPDEQYGDAGFVNGQTILDSASNDIVLQGPSSGRSQSIETFNAEDRPLDVADFKTEIEGDALKVISCPENKTPIDQARSSKTGKLIVHFDPEICTECDQNDRCPVKIGVRVCTLDIDERMLAGATRHHKYMEDAEYRKKCAIRAGAEATVSEFTRGHGVRNSRHRTESRTRLQLLFAAIACNVKRFIGHGERCGIIEVIA